MHLADGIVTDPSLVGGFSLLAAGAVAVALRTVEKDDLRLGWTGTLAAFVFVAQAINVPVVPGASAHVIGASLLTLTAGPARAIIALTAVLFAQALLLADGGISVIGVNVLTLAILPVVVLAATRSWLSYVLRDSVPATAVIGTALGNAAGAALLSGVLVIGAGAPAASTFAWLVGIQAFSGLVEGVLTAIAVGRLRRLAPALLAPSSRRRIEAAQRSSGHAFAWAAIAIFVALCLMPFASDTPDALEHLVHELHAER